MTAPALVSRTVYVVDDNADFCESAAWWLEGLGYTVETFLDPAECLDSLVRLRPEPGCGCLLLDVRMPGMSGLQLADALRRERLALPIVYVTGHGDVPLAVEAMRKGAVTFLEKPLQEAALEEALAQAFSAPAAPVDTAAGREYQRRLTTLTNREREIMGLIVDGRINKVIAADLGISIKTVELHRKRVMDKMRARSLPHLLKMAMRREAEMEA